MRIVLQETCVKPLPTEWTNETHSLYLKSIEASFVDQLYNNMGFPCFKPSKKSFIEPKSHLHSSVRTSAGQFKTLRGGHWQKISVGEVQTEGHNAPTSLLSNPWIRHYRHSERYHLSSVCQEKDAAIDKEINSRRKAAGLNNPHLPVFTDNNTEASGQNFVNDDIMEGKRSSLCSTQQLMI
ncbi:unnamed protein product [Rhodiola kirilowii]